MVNNLARIGLAIALVALVSGTARAQMGGHMGGGSGGGMGSDHMQQMHQMNQMMQHMNDVMHQAGCMTQEMQGHMQDHQGWMMDQHRTMQRMRDCVGSMGQPVCPSVDHGSRMADRPRVTAAPENPPPKK